MNNCTITLCFVLLFKYGIAHVFENKLRQISDDRNRNHFFTCGIFFVGTFYFNNIVAKVCQIFCEYIFRRLNALEKNLVNQIGKEVKSRKKFIKGHCCC